MSFSDIKRLSLVRIENKCIFMVTSDNKCLCLVIIENNCFCQVTFDNDNDKLDINWSRLRGVQY